ncbi:methyltransferase [Paraburkholderia sp. 2C]
MSASSLKPPLQRPPHALDPNTERMMQMIYGFAVSQVVRTFAEFGIADHLASGPLAAADIARRIEADEETTRRLMNAAVPLELVTVDANARYSSTPLLRTLEEGAPGSVRGLSRLLGGPATWQIWGRLPMAIRSGAAQDTAALGENFWDYLGRAPADLAVLIRAMTDISDAVGEQIAQAIDTSSIATVADIGGGSGELIRPMLAKTPHLNGVVMDTPASVEQSSRDPVNTALAPRLSFVGGDFFKDVPAGFDLYMLKHILHDWNDERCVEILANCARAMRPDSRLAVIEMVVKPHGNEPRVMLQDLNMLVHFGARERTMQDFERLLGHVGLVRSATAEVVSPLGTTTVIEARKR